MILTVTVNPAVDQTLFVDGLKPYDTNRVVRAETDAGGKGVNLSRMAAELGAPTFATGFLAGSTGRFVRVVLDQQGVAHDFVEVGGQTRTNFLVEDGSGKPPTTFNSQGAPVEPAQWKALLEKVGERLDGASWLCVGGSLPPGLAPDAFQTLGRLARQAGVKWALDADGQPMRLGMEAGPDFIKPNAEEAARLLGMPVTGVAQALHAADRLREELAENGSPEPMVVVSLGGQGAVLASSVGHFVAEPIPIEPKSTIGSGDSLVAGFLTGLLRGLPYEDCLRLGNAAGAATAMTNGSEIGRRSEVEELLGQSVVTHC